MSRGNNIQYTLKYLYVENKFQASTCKIMIEIVSTTLEET